MSPFDAVANFRDFGGYATASGARLRTGLLYRSAHLAHATDADLARLTDLGIAVIVDLRRLVERDAEPGRRPIGYGGLVFECDVEEAGLSPDSGLQKLRLPVQAYRDRSRGFYARCPFEERYVDLFRRYFHAIADGHGPVLVHCASGKDRTGLLCALTHRLAGVGEADMIADYMATNALLAGRLPYFRKAALEITGREMSDAELLAYVGAGPDYLEAAFGAMADRCGSLDGYCAEMLGIDDDYGSLEAKKVADLVLFDGDPFEYTSHVTAVVMGGEVVFQR